MDYFKKALRAHQGGQFGDAKRLYNKYVKQHPQDANAYHNLALVEGALGNLDASHQYFLKAIQIDDSQPEYFYNLGHSFQTLEQLQNAVDCYKMALDRKPDHFNALANLGFLLLEHGRIAEAFPVFIQGLGYFPESEQFLHGLVNVFGWYKVEEQSQGMADVLEQLLYRENVDTAKLAINAANQLLGRYDAKAGFNLDMLSDRLLLAFLSNCINIDINLERLLIQVRSDLLQLHAQGKLNENYIPLLLALNLQVFNNEYVWFQHEEESRALNKLEISDLQSWLVFSLYKLIDLPDSINLESFAQQSWYSQLQHCIDKIIGQPQQEKILTAEIPSMSKISAGVSSKVAQQYEEHPYPRWTRLTVSNSNKDALAYFAARFPQFSPPESFKKPVSILVAGCGTGKHPISLALELPSAQITAIDLSRASLAYAQRKANELGVSNIRFKHGDILKLDELDGTFNWVESMGVIHHMENPEEGLKKLVEKVEPLGVIKLGLYSKTARAWREPLVEFAYQNGFDGSTESIRNFRHSIYQNELGEVLRKHGDSYSTSACRDLLFHVQEHQYDCDQIERILERNGLTFVGMQVKQWEQKTFTNMFPQSEAHINLNNWAEFEKLYPDTFSNMYQFFVQKTD